MAWVVLAGDGGKAITLHMTSEPVTLTPGVPVEVPEGYRRSLTNQALTAPHVIRDHEPQPVESIPAPPKGGRKPKEG